MSDHLPPYNADDILRYLEGGMTGTEMHKLERRALEDPFLQEAIEGYQYATNLDQKQQMASALHRARQAGQLAGKNEKTLVLPFWKQKVFQYAVAASVVAASGWWLVDIVTTPADSAVKQEMATASSPAAIADSIQMATETVREPAASDLAIAENPIPAPVSEKPLAPSPPAAVAKDNASPDKIPPQAEPAIAAVSANATADEAKVTPPEAAKAPARSAPPNNGAKSASEANAIKSLAPGNQVASAKSMPKENTNVDPLSAFGQTVNEAGEPVEYVKIRNKDGKLLAQSDELGRFSLQLPDTVAQLLAQGAGYPQQDVIVKSGAQKNILKLKAADRSLEEMVVSDMSGNRQEQPARPVVQLTETIAPNAQPAGGWRALERYLQGYIAGVQEGLKGEVTIQFGFSALEMPANFKIIKTSSASLGELMQKALQDGPAWLLGKSNKTEAKATLTIQVK